MARQFSKQFYTSTQWEKTRLATLAKAYGMCEVCCSKPAVIVHHILMLTPERITHPEITLGQDNLIAVCLQCHNAIHEETGATAPGLGFDANGNLQCIQDDAAYKIGILKECLNNYNLDRQSLDSKLGGDSYGDN